MLCKLNKIKGFQNYFPFLLTSFKYGSLFLPRDKKIRAAIATFCHSEKSMSEMHARNPEIFFSCYSGLFFFEFELTLCSSDFWFLSRKDNCSFLSFDSDLQFFLQLREKMSEMQDIISAFWHVLYNSDFFFLWILSLSRNSEFFRHRL